MTSGLDHRLDLGVARHLAGQRHRLAAGGVDQRHGLGRRLGGDSRRRRRARPRAPRRARRRGRCRRRAPVINADFPSSKPAIAPSSGLVGLSCLLRLDAQDLDRRRRRGHWLRSGIPTSPCPLRPGVGEGDEGRRRSRGWRRGPAFVYLRERNAGAGDGHSAGGERGAARRSAAAAGAAGGAAPRSPRAVPAVLRHRAGCLPLCRRAAPSAS